MEQERLQKAMELFEIPANLEQAAQAMVQEVEWELILAMGKDPMTDADLRALIEKHKLAADPADFIRLCYSRAILNKVTDLEEPAWKISNLYGRYPYFAQYEYYAYGKLSRETKDALNAFDLEVYLGIYADDVRSKMRGENTHVHNSDFLTLEEAYAFVEKHEGHIYLYPCNCKCMMYYHDRPLNVCMGFYDGPNSEADRGHGERLTVRQAKEKLKEFNRKGLMQNGEDYAICNCDGYCCYPLQMARSVGAKGVYPKSHYDIDWHPEECINCGKCTTICNFGAFQRGADKTVTYRKDLCWGCTICAPNCPKGAIHLIPKQN